jgi:chromosomal replication initiator protein
MSTGNLETTWNRIRSDLRSVVSDSTFQVWIDPLKATHLDDQVLVVEAPESIIHWVETKFASVIAEATTRITGSKPKVHVAAPGRVSDFTSQPKSQPSSKAGESTEPLENQDHSGTFDLNPRLSFDQFVIGESNRLAHAACLAVAEMPSQTYNPLFIYGPPGTGKTHLLHAIGNLASQTDPSVRVRYSTAESFTSEFVRSVRDGQTSSFKRRFRDVDLLLVDDAQFLENKTKTEEEFFHTFNSVIESGAQVVITCDRTPANLAALEDRLRERFASGLVAGIDTPEIQARLAILSMRVRRDQLGDVPGETLEAIAHRIRGNVRSLEGALIRVVAYASLTGSHLTRDLTAQVLDQLYPSATNIQRRLSTSEIKSVVADAFGVSEADLESPSRAAKYTWPRQVAMYLARETAGEPLPAIGREFGGRNHSTVLNACRRVEARMTSSPEDALAVKSLERRLSTQD